MEPANDNFRFDFSALYRNARNYADLAVETHRVQAGDLGHTQTGMASICEGFMDSVLEAYSKSFGKEKTAQILYKAADAIAAECPLQNVNPKFWDGKGPEIA